MTNANSKAFSRKTKQELIDCIELMQSRIRDLKSVLNEKDTSLEKLKYLDTVIEESIFEIFVIDSLSYKFIHANKRARENLGYTLYNG